MLGRIKNWLVFQLEQLMMRGTFARFGFVLSVLALVALATGILVRLLVPGFDSLGEAIWWAFQHVVVPEYVDGEDGGAVKITFATVLIVLGSILFAGAVIAILVQWMNDTTARLEQGLTPVALSKHVIILGWTDRTPTIVAELLHTGPRRERFLARYGARKLRIVVLAKQVDAALVKELRERVGDVWNSRNVLLRSGSPLNADDLERVAFQDAAVLIIPGGGFTERTPEFVDAETVKTLLSMSNDASRPGSACPLAVIELYDGRRAAVARRVYGADSEIIIADELVSRLIVQSVRQHGLCDVYVELFTLNFGVALFVRGAAGIAGAKFKDARGRFDRAILIGTFRAASPRPMLNPEPDTALGDDDLLVFIAKSFDDCVPHAEGSSPEPSLAHLPVRTTTRARRVLVLGWNRKVPVLLWEFQRYAKETFEIDIVSSTPVEDRERSLARYGRVKQSDRVRQIEASYTVPGVLAGLEPQSYDNIVLLPSERFLDEKRADAITVFTYQLLLGMLPSSGTRPDIFVELLGEENQTLFQAQQADVIVSPLVVSYMLSQVSLRQELAALFEELSRPEGVQLLLTPAQDYSALGASVRFEDIGVAAAARGEIALGIRRVEDPDAGLMMNPDRDSRWTPAPGDKVLVLAPDAGAVDGGNNNGARENSAS